LYESPHTKITQFLKVRYKCRILPHGKEIEYTDFVMGSRQDNHDIDITTSQIK